MTSWVRAAHNISIHFFVDIGVNLTDPMYQGEYNGSKKHEADLEDVLDRSRAQGLQKLIITGGNLEDSKKALELAKQKGNPLFPNLKSSGSTQKYNLGIF